jgi:dTDP-4-amino-4,6-dideoxygalactose transaminase
VKFNNGFIINPPAFRESHLYLSPFSAKDAYFNRQIWQRKIEDAEPVVELHQKKMTITESATLALELVLKHLKLAPDDEVWIVTTSGCAYISGCVTRTIEKFCRWSRQKTDRTAAILVNHEFGFLYKDIAALKAYSLPIIEDKAYSMYSTYKDRNLNFTGDYEIYSMAKMFPMQAGGLLYAKHTLLPQHNLTAEAASYLKACFLHYHSQREFITHQRMQNYIALGMMFTILFDFGQGFPIDYGDIPGAFIFCTKGKIDLDNLKIYMQKQGVESSVFYGEEAFYIPCHQNMNLEHLEYITTLIKNFMK